MSLKHLGYIELPEHTGQGGFDHAAVHRRRARLYVAHTANDSLEVIDLEDRHHVRFISDLKGVAGAVVDESTDLVFTSNRGENTVGILSPDSEEHVTKVAVGARPNGLAYDTGRALLLCANVGVADLDDPPSVSLVDVDARCLLRTIPMPGRTRWTVFDPDQQVFFVNIAEPSEIVVIDAQNPQEIMKRIPIPARGPHGLDLDPHQHRLYCACDEGKLIGIDARTGKILGALELSGAPDVVFLNPALDHLYVAVGDPGVVDVIDVGAWRRAETLSTEAGAHTLAFDAGSNQVHVFLPRTHRASVYQDE